MVSLWGSNKNGEEGHDEGEDHDQLAQTSSSDHQPRRSEANERTRLLPPSNGGFLDPDDPAVCCKSVVHSLGPSLTSLRFPHIISSECELSDTSKSSSLSSASFGGCYYWSPPLSVHQSSILEALASSTSPIQVSPLATSWLDCCSSQCHPPPWGSSAWSCPSS